METLDKTSPETEDNHGKCKYLTSNFKYNNKKISHSKMTIQL